MTPIKKNNDERGARPQRASERSGERKSSAPRKREDSRGSRAGEGRSSYAPKQREGSRDWKPRTERTSSAPREREESRGRKTGTGRTPYAPKQREDSRDWKPRTERTSSAPREREESRGRKTGTGRTPYAPKQREDSRDWKPRTERTSSAPREREESRGRSSGTSRGASAPRKREDSRGTRDYSEKPKTRSPRAEKPDARRTAKSKKSEETGAIRLNRYIARSGICSRREADELIITGEVKVNGVVVTELGTKVSNADKIHVGDELIRFEKPVYLLLNKPKGYITTTDDPQKRRTVMALVENACKENIYPVGRLDRNTTGLLLFTNDGDMAKKLTHPSSNIRKIYHVHLDKALTKADMVKIAEGLTLDDGFIRVDEIDWVGDGKDRKEVGMALHSGKNRIVRRIFESLGYQVVKLDRVSFANLTKKDLKRGHHRFLTPQEVNFLKML